ncbi:MAG: hypothetical protein PF692_09990 [Kiritimatiellae bacterium]|jgi:hypothetical protein|nr:hypothetical protein [Kiritimatiellia bacterium]
MKSKKIKYVIVVFVVLFVCHFAILEVAGYLHKRKRLYQKQVVYVSFVKEAIRGFIYYNRDNTIFEINSAFCLDSRKKDILNGETTNDISTNRYIYLDDMDLEVIKKRGYVFWGMIETNSAGNIGVNVWSEGPNKRNDNGLKDDINSWEKNYRKWFFRSLFSF